MSKLFSIKPILMIFILFIFQLNYSFTQTSKEITDVTEVFLNTLTQNQFKQISLEFKDTLRTKWTNLPVGLAPRSGLRFGDLSENSKIKFHHILTTLLSSQGYLKITSIMNLDDILNEFYKIVYEKKIISEKDYEELKALNWDYDNYYVSVWGKPNLRDPWGLKFEGHHISINLSVAGEKFSLTPLFLGTDPAEVELTKHAGLRVLSKEEDYGLRLINSLTEEQKTIATISAEPPIDIITNPNSSQRIKEYKGIKAANLSQAQKAILKIIIKEYINNLEHDKAHEYLEKIDNSGIDRLYFAWMGSYVIRKPNYYIINGPDFIIEYDNVGFQKNGNHIHSIWREKGNDFGEDILREHYIKHLH